MGARVTVQRLTGSIGAEVNGVNTTSAPPIRFKRIFRHSLRSEEE